MAQDSGNENCEYIQNNDCKICYHDSGSGNTTILLVSGLTQGLDTWKSFQERLSRYARVMSYDRSGLGNSDYIPNNKNMDSMIQELDRVINELHADTPIILVGHSVGGHIVRKYTELFPKKIKALFLIDVYHESFYKELRDSVTERMWDDYISSWVNMKSNTSSGGSDELGFYLELLESDERYINPSDIPVYLFTSMKEAEVEEKFVEFNKMAYKVHLRLNNQLDEKYKNMNHIITDKSSHFIYLEEPELIENEMLKLIGR